MKKKLLAGLIAGALTVAFATSAFAAQLMTGTPGQDPVDKYLATPKVFNADAKSNYPYEIYLPNETEPANYRIHSNYTKNTDACAACHATHTAVGNSLLQWYTVYDTCMACHDGTVTTTYNVEEGKIGTNMPTFGGMFGNGSEASLSNHNVTGAMEIAAAPGGSVMDNETVAGAHGATNTRWAVEFGCESCHTPHGQGGNARILHPDANYAASWAAKNKADGAYKYYVSPVSGYVYADTAFATDPLYIIKGYPYSPAIKVDGAASYTLKIDNTTGLSKVYGAPANTVIENGVASLSVKMAITDYLKDTEAVEHKAGMNFFCGACHTDYNTKAFTDNGSAGMETGVYSKAHRHQVGFDIPYFNFSKNNMVKENGTMECLTCHVAHGTSQDYWARTLNTKDAAYWPAAATDPKYAEISGSSALKRMPNMGTCEACHSKGDGNEGYNANTAQVGFANTAPTSVDGLMPNTYNFDARTADYAVADLGWVGNAKCTACHKEYVEGWSETKHATSSHTGATGCGRCHNPGNSIMGFADVAGADDSGITCESCHGTGARHIAAPTTKNIFNPGTASIERQVVECGRCHDMYANTAADSFGLSATSGLSHTSVAKSKTADIVSKTGWSVAFRVYNEDPAKFAIASQKTATSNHYGGSWGYADSKHFLGLTGTPENPAGIVSCTTCHDMHSDKNPGVLKGSYEQVCSACHGMTASLAQSVAMPTNAWNRHQIELRDYAHSFKFGAPAAIASAQVDFVNLEVATLGLTPVVTTLTNHYDGTSQTTKNNSLWRNATSGGGIGPKLIVKDASGNQVFNNYDGTWELLASPATAVEGTDFHFEPTGAIEFENNATTYDTAKLLGTYTVKWTSKAVPTLTVTKSFTIVD